MRDALAKRLPRTKITAVDCNKLTGLCEVSAGNTLFYTDRNARYLVIGRVYDMETRTDLTAAKLLELNPDTLLGAAAHNDAAAGDAGVRSVPTRVSLAELPTGGAIRWGPGGGGEGHRVHRFPLSLLHEAVGEPREHRRGSRSGQSRCLAPAP